MATTKKAAKRSRRLKLYQCVVRWRGRTVHASETGEERVGRPRVKRETIAAGVGAIGTLYRVNRKANNALEPIYEVRAVHTGRKGNVGVTPEDHTTPPPEAQAPNADQRPA